MKNYILLVVFIMAKLAFSDEVVFKNGDLLINVTVISSDETLVQVKYTDETVRTIKKSIIQHIVEKDIEGETKLIKSRSYISIQNDSYKKTNYESLYLLPASIGFFTLSFEKFDSIRQLKKIEQDIPTKHYVYGAIYFTSGVFLFLKGIEKVSLQTDGKMIGITYKF